MKFILDTHAFLWFISDNASLNATARDLIEDATNIIYLSTPSLWEIAIKASLGKLEIPSPFAAFITEQLRQNNILLLEVKPEHIGVVATLPFVHRDPFDRMIIAQSLIENFPVIGKDAMFDLYAVKRFW